MRHTKAGILSARLADMGMGASDLVHLLQELGDPAAPHAIVRQ